MSELSVTRADQNVSSDNINQENCPICLGVPQNQAKPDCCKHVFCTECILEWQKVRLFLLEKIDAISTESEALTT